MHKVKYTRQEYREEYLRSDEWKVLRAKVMLPGARCFKCTVRSATDPHHMRYRSIVDVRPSDLVPLCRDCHEFVESAKKRGFLPKEHSREQLLAVTPESIQKIINAKRRKTVFARELVETMPSMTPLGRRLIMGILKIPLPRNLEELVGLKVIEGNLAEIRRIIVRHANQPIRPLPPKELRNVSKNKCYRAVLSDERREVREFIAEREAALAKKRVILNPIKKPKKKKKR